LLMCLLMNWMRLRCTCSSCLPSSSFCSVYKCLNVANVPDFLLISLVIMRDLFDWNEFNLFFFIGMSFIMRDFLLISLVIMRHLIPECFLYPRPSNNGPWWNFLSKLILWKQIRSFIL
jgi:hypothetical protein